MRVAVAAAVGAFDCAVTAYVAIGLAGFAADDAKPSAPKLAPMAIVAETTVMEIAVAAAITAQRSGTMVAFLGIFGWGLFASTLVPALAVGLNWQGATREGAIASILTGLVITLALETAAYLKAFRFPAGVTASAVAMVSSFLVFFAVSWLTRRTAQSAIDPDVRLVMEL